MYTGRVLTFCNMHGPNLLPLNVTYDFYNFLTFAAQPSDLAASLSLHASLLRMKFVLPILQIMKQIPSDKYTFNVLERYRYREFMTIMYQVPF